MSDKELNKCGCGCGCGEEEVKENTCGCGDDCGCDEEEGHECGCGCGEHDHETFFVELEDEEGNIISCPVVDAFEYKEKEYVLVQNEEDGSVYLFRSEGEDGELIIPEDEEFEEVTKYYETELTE